MNDLDRHPLRLAWLLAVSLAGCGGGAGDGLPRHAVSGAVTLDGRPMDRGTIQFLPDAPDLPTAALVDVQGGKFTVTRDRGLVPGRYKVLVSCTDAGATVKPDALPGMTGPPAKELLPARYNVESTLNAEVKDGAPNTFDFPLTSK
jgi:hypothetical protein